MATQASSHKSVDVGSALSTLVRMLGGHQYVQQWSMDILARVVQLKDRASNEQRRDIKETTSQLVRRLDQVINNLVTRPVGELHSEDLFFSGSIVSLAICTSRSCSLFHDAKNRPRVLCSLHLNSLRLVSSGSTPPCRVHQFSEGLR